MENYKKEKSSKQHLKIDLGHSQDQTEDGIFMLANPMTYGDATTPTSPKNYNMPHRGRIVSNPNTPTNQNPQGGFARSVERWSLKSKSKSPSSKFKLFGRNSSGGNNAVVQKDEEDGSSGSDDHEDPFSPSAGDLVHSSRRMSEPPRSPMSERVPKIGRHHGGHSSRDSGFSSERESVSHLKDDSINTQQSNGDDVGEAPSDLDEYQPAGMDALEILHNQLQLLVKRDTDEDTDSVSVYEQVIANLSKQLEDQSLALDSLRQSEAHLRASLETTEQRALEAESKLIYVTKRCIQAEKRYVSASSKYKSLKKQHAEHDPHNPTQSQQKKRHSGSSRSSYQTSGNRRASKSHSYSPESSSVHALSHSHSPDSNHKQSVSDSSRIPPQRVQSQTLYDRQQGKVDASGPPDKRPSTAQGFHEDIITASISSLSHTETSV